MEWDLEGFDHHFEEWKQILSVPRKCRPTFLVGFKGFYGVFEQIFVSRVYFWERAKNLNPMGFGGFSTINFRFLLYRADDERISSQDVPTFQRNLEVEYWNIMNIHEQQHLGIEYPRMPISNKLTQLKRRVKRKHRYLEPAQQAGATTTQLRNMRRALHRAQTRRNLLTRKHTCYILMQRSLKVNA